MLHHRLLSILGAVVVLALPLQAQPGHNDNIHKVVKHGGVGVKVGGINTGSVTITGRPTIDDAARVFGKRYDPAASVAAQVFFDVPVHRRLALVFSADFYNIRMQNMSEPFIDVAAGFKLMLYREGSRVVWRPGGAIGLGYLADIGFLDPTTYLTLKVFTELLVVPRGLWAYVIDVGVVAAPSGGNSEVDVSVNPSFYARVGLLY